jgi:excinuclease ABC subunit C
LAPCQGNCDESYKNEVSKVITFLEGGYEELIAQLKEEMHQLSKNLQFEQAAELRDKLKTIERIANKQTVIAPDKVRRDIWYFANNEKFAVGTLIMMEHGRIIGVQHFYGKNFASVLDKSATGRHSNIGESLVEWSAGLYRDERERFLSTYYSDHERPTEIILPEDYKSGFRYELIQIARRNALKALQDKMLESLKDRSPAKALQRLQEILDLEKLPERIDCFDISHIQGNETVASMVVFRNGLPDKNAYRRYILEQTTPDDFSSMQEVLSRRFLKVATGEAERPDLILIDGGKGQLAIAVKVLNILQLNIPVISLAKENEEIFFPERKNPLILKRTDPGLRLLQRLRDEAHRFAITFHRLRRKKRMLQ